MNIDLQIFGICATIPTRLLYAESVKTELCIAEQQQPIENLLRNRQEFSWQRKIHLKVILIVK